MTVIDENLGSVDRKAFRIIQAPVVSLKKRLYVFGITISRDPIDQT